jgi:hypothetical protein
MFTMISVLLMFSSLGGLLMGGVTLLARVRYRLRASHAIGTIQGYERMTCEEYVDGQQRTVVASFAVFTFNDEEGRAHTVTSKIGGGQPFAIGAAVPILYDPANPTQASINTFWFTVGVPLFLTSLSLLTLAGSIGFWYVTREVR